MLRGIGVFGLKGGQSHEGLDWCVRVIGRRFLVYNLEIDVHLSRYAKIKSSLFFSRNYCMRAKQYPHCVLMQCGSSWMMIRLSCAY